MKKNCIRCKNEYDKKPCDSRKTWAKKLFCSVKCANIANSEIGHQKLRGRKRPFEVVEQMKATMFKPGLTPWNKGKDWPEMKEENHPRWMGDQIKYSGIHMWVKSKLGTPSKCEHCGTTSKPSRHYQWSNKDHRYQRTLEDWQRLCAKCHATYDRQLV